MIWDSSSGSLRGTLLLGDGGLDSFCGQVDDAIYTR